MALKKAGFIPIPPGEQPAATNSARRNGGTSDEFEAHYDCLESGHSYMRFCRPAEMPQHSLNSKSIRR